MEAEIIYEHNACTQNWNDFDYLKYAFAASNTLSSAAKLRGCMIYNAQHSAQIPLRAGRALCPNCK